MFRRRRSFSVGGMVLAGLGLSLISGCGGASSRTTAATDRGNPVPSDVRPNIPAASGPLTGHVGDTLKYVDLGGDEIDLTVVKITDPATTGSTSGGLPSGERWVGVELTINDHEDDPAEDANAVEGTGSDGQRHGASVDGGYRVYGFDGCAPTAKSAANQPITYCSGFAVPVGVTLKLIGYSVAGVNIGAPDDVEWSIP